MLAAKFPLKRPIKGDEKKGFSRFSFARVFALSALIAAPSTYENARRGGRRARNTPVFGHATSGAKSVAADRIRGANEPATAKATVAANKRAEQRPLFI